MIDRYFSKIAENPLPIVVSLCLLACLFNELTIVSHHFTHRMIGSSGSMDIFQENPRLLYSSVILLINLAAFTGSLHPRLSQWFENRK